MLSIIPENWRARASSLPGIDNSTDICLDFARIGHQLVVDTAGRMQHSKPQGQLLARRLPDGTCQLLPPCRMVALTHSLGSTKKFVVKE